MTDHMLRAVGLYTYADYLSWPAEERWELIRVQGSRAGFEFDLL